MDIFLTSILSILMELLYFSPGCFWNFPLTGQKTFMKGIYFWRIKNWYRILKIFYKIFSMVYYDDDRWGRTRCQVLTEFPALLTVISSPCLSILPVTETEDPVEGARRDHGPTILTSRPDIRPRYLYQKIIAFICFGSLILTFNSSDGLIHL